MATLPAIQTQSRLSQMIPAARKAADKPRYSSRIGASWIGTPCQRKIWLSYHWAMMPNFSGQMLRLFDTGHREEARVAEDIERAGFEVALFDPDAPEPNTQFEFTDESGEIVFKADGIVNGTPESKEIHLLEIKTMNDRLFKTLDSKGVQKSHPHYYAQAQVGMRLAGLDRCLFVAVNKNDDDVYTERLRIDAKFADELIARAQEISKMVQPPDRIGLDPADKECQYCDFKDLCWSQKFPDVNCRTCTFYSHKKCTLPRHERDLTKEDQIKGCEEHIYISGMINAREVDAGVSEDGKMFVEYENAKGKRFINANALGCTDVYPSRELVKLTINGV